MEQVIKYSDIKINRKDFFVTLAFILTAKEQKKFEAKADYRTESWKNLENIVFSKGTTIYRTYKILSGEEEIIKSNEQVFFKENQLALYIKKEENLDEFIEYDEAREIISILYAQYGIDLKYFFDKIIECCKNNEGRISLNDQITMVCDYVEDQRKNNLLEMDYTNILMSLARNLVKKDDN